MLYVFVIAAVALVAWGIWVWRSTLVSPLLKVASSARYAAKLDASRKKAVASHNQAMAKAAESKAKKSRRQG